MTQQILEIVLFLLFVSLPIIAALVSLFLAFQFLKKSRLLEDTPTSRIRSAAQGYVEFLGTAQPFLEPISSLITKTPCVWYRYRVEEWRTFQTNEGSRSAYQFLHQDSSASFFLLRDPTGECLINPAHATVLVQRRRVAYGHEPIPKAIFPWSFWFNIFGNIPRFRYYEEHIQMGDELQATGVFKSCNKGEFYEHFLNNAQYEQIQLRLESYLTRKNTQQVDFLTERDLPSNYTFLISTLSQTHLNKQYRWKIAFFLSLFVFFCFLTLNSMYPIVYNTIQNWHSSNGYRFIPLFQ